MKFENKVVVLTGGVKGIEGVLKRRLKNKGRMFV